MSTILAAPTAKTPPLLRHLDAAPLLDAVRRARIQLNTLPEEVQRAYFRAQVRGTLTRAAADQLACRLLHEHPSTIWGERWWGAA